MLELCMSYLDLFVDIMICEVLWRILYDSNSEGNRGINPLWEHPRLHTAHSIRLQQHITLLSGRTVHRVSALNYLQLLGTPRHFGRVLFASGYFLVDCGPRLQR